MVSDVYLVYRLFLLDDENLSIFLPEPASPGVAVNFSMLSFVKLILGLSKAKLGPLPEIHICTKSLEALIGLIYEIILFFRPKEMIK